MDHGLSAAAVALLDSLRMATTPPDGWVTANQMSEYLGIDKRCAHSKMQKMGWDRVLVRANKMPPTYYYGPKK